MSVLDAVAYTIDPALCARRRPGSLKDDDLAGRMGLQLKELNKITVVLENDKLLRVYVLMFVVIFSRAHAGHSHRQNELKEGAQRSVGRQYF